MKSFKHYLLIFPLMGMTSCCQIYPSMCPPPKEAKTVWIILSAANEQKYRKATDFLNLVQYSSGNIEKGTSLVRPGNRHELFIVCKNLEPIRSIPTADVNQNLLKEVIGDNIFTELGNKYKDKNAGCQSTIKSSVSLTVDKINKYITGGKWKESKVNHLHIFLQAGTGGLNNTEYLQLKKEAAEIKIPQGLIFSLNIFDVDKETNLNEVFQPLGESYRKIVGNSEDMGNYLGSFTGKKLNQ